jgi:ABC-2 type transport system ATP-binding protein
MKYFGVLHGLSADESLKRAKDYLKRVGLADKENEQLLKLSGGQQQKVQLGVTILHEPSLMILDEPTEALDPVNRSLLMGIINEQREKGASVILVTHRMEEVEQLCDRALLLKDGKRVLYGTVDEVKDEHSGKTITLTFAGTLSENPELYTITKQLPHSAEINPVGKADSEKILRTLVDNKDLHLTAFELKRTSLNDIFIDIYKGENNGRN